MFGWYLKRMGLRWIVPGKVRQEVIRISKDWRRVGFCLPREFLASRWFEANVVWEGGPGDLGEKKLLMASTLLHQVCMTGTFLPVHKDDEVVRPR